jgi:hypothetical protein
MPVEKMTIHRALSELKIIDDRINKAITAAPFCVSNRHSNHKIDGQPLTEYEETIKANYTRALALIDRRNAIKKGVVRSNAQTVVKVGSIRLTVAEAIEMKNHGILFLEVLFEKLQYDYKRAKAEILKNNGAELEQHADDYVTGLFGGKDNNQNIGDIHLAKQQFIENNALDLIDPTDIQAQIVFVENQISAFKAEVDAVLSTSNAITEIEISY